MILVVRVKTRVVRDKTRVVRVQTRVVRLDKLLCLRHEFKARLLLVRDHVEKVFVKLLALLDEGVEGAVGVRAELLYCDHHSAWLLREQGQILGHSNLCNTYNAEFNIYFYKPITSHTPIIIIIIEICNSYGGNVYAKDNVMTNIV